VRLARIVHERNDLLYLIVGIKGRDLAVESNFKATFPLDSPGARRWRRVGGAQ
jgi:hypothetical protein